MERFYCKICSRKYGERNPPRLIPVCGHSFCESCIKMKLMKTKGNRECQVICPLDLKENICQDGDISNFPKNFKLIKEILNASLQMVDLTSHEMFKANESKYLKASEDENISRSSNFVRSSTEGHLPENVFKSQQQIEYVSLQNESEMCTIHQKRLQIICIQDSTKICVSCAIFGEHKGHEFRSIEQLQKDKIKKYGDILNIFDKKQSVCVKINHQEIKQQICRVMKIKRDSVENQIKERFLKLIEIVQGAEKKSLENLGKVFQTIEEKIEGQLRFLEYPLSQYENWEEKAMKGLEVLESKFNFQQQLRLLDYARKCKQLDVVQQGEMILKSLQNSSKSQIKVVEDLLERVRLQFDQETVRRITTYALIYLHEPKEKHEELLLKQNSSIIEEYLLDNIKINSNQKIKNNKVSPPLTPEVLKMRTEPSSPGSNTKITNNLLGSMRSPNKIKDAFDNMITSKEVIRKKFKLKLPEKYEKMVQTILNDNTDVLDLSNAQLGDQITLQILETLKNKKLRVIKLMRNKLTDEICPGFFPLVPNVSTLNLSQNNLSDRILDALIINHKKLLYLKTIILSQNKIKQRNIRGKLEEIKNLDIIISL